MPVLVRLKGAGRVRRLPLSFDQVYEATPHNLVDIVVETVVKAVDVVEPTAPACPLTIADPTLSEANHPATIGIDAVAEVEVLYLYLMLACCHGSNDILVLTDGNKG